METSLHRQLKGLYGDADRQELPLASYRIDAIVGKELVEIQAAGLSAIRDKIRELTTSHRVRVVKPIAARTKILRYPTASGPVGSTRLSPLKRTVWHLFEELVHFMGVFPHRNLTLEVLLIEIEEHRTAKQRTRFRGKDYVVRDRMLTSVIERVEFKSARDLSRLLPTNLPKEFTTAELAQTAEIPRWLAQKACYCFRAAETIGLVGKRGHALLYRAPVRRRRAA